MSSRRVALVLGDHRTRHALTGVLGALGMHEPGPSWVADLHTDLLARTNVDTDDARPSAWFETGKWAANGMPRSRATEWLDQQFAPPPEEEDEPEVLLGDHAMVWFVGLWKAAAMRCGAEVGLVVGLRAPADVAAGVAAEEENWNPTAATAGWLNTMLHAEKATRGAARAFVRHEDLLSDWTVPIFRAGRELGLRTVTEASANDMRKVHHFLASGQRGEPGDWEELGVDPSIRGMADAAWVELSSLADPDGDTADRATALDAIREEYVATYAAAERLAEASVRAAARGSRPDEPPPEGRSRKRLFGR